jgi:hypothetical protein
VRSALLGQALEHALSTGHCSDYLIRPSCVLDTESDCAAEYQSCNKSVASEGYADAGRFYRFRCCIAQEGKGEIHLTLRFKNIPDRTGGVLIEKPRSL